MQEKLSKLNQSVEKTMRLVDIMADAGSAMRLQDIAEASGIPTSTALRMLNTLLSMGYVNQDAETLKYSLSLKFAYIGERAKQQSSLLQIVHPYLQELAERVGECACFAVEQAHEVVYLDFISGASDNILTVTQRIGKRAPLYCTGIGKLFLTEYTEDELDDYLRTTELVRFTDTTLATPELLRAALPQIRAQGYAPDNEECDIGTRCVAAPVRDYTGRIVAGISVTAPSLRLTSQRADEILPIIQETVAAVSARLAYQGK
jgi:DNA-binding IclR family transcriptional regulator